MQVKQMHAGLGFWLLWVLASIIGFTLSGFLFHFPFGFPAGANTSFDPANAEVGFIQGALTGLVIGTIQWLVLRRLISRAGWWILATCWGIAVAHAVGDSAPAPITLWVLALLCGAVIGSLQWLILRQLTSRAVLWVAANIVGWYLGLTLGMALAESTGLMALTGPDGWVKQHSVVGSITGIVIGVITGILLTWLVRHPLPQKVMQAAPQSSTV